MMAKKVINLRINERGFESIVSLVKETKETVFIFEPTGIYSYAINRVL
jgi:hypothetical protein